MCNTVNLKWKSWSGYDQEALGASFLQRTEDGRGRQPGGGSGGGGSGGGSGGGGDRQARSERPRQTDRRNA